ncbi:MAG TPA: carboxypeptidase-like regulatory domain-containing protein [Thermoanaerobaculia bacterium]|nr:carboxypeptidase-like regulatory domain-containing protein [Thermoanaerobaculia bacterium]
MKLFKSFLPVLLALACLSAAPAHGARYEDGQRIQVTGAVLDAQGQPLSGVRVVLEGTRTYFSIRELRRTAEKDVRKVTATTDAAGQYTIVWPWDSYFNHFEVAVGVPVRAKAGERLEELARQDVTRRVLAGSPAVVAVTVENRKFIDNLRELLESIKTDDQRRVYEEMGKPDRVRNVQYPGYMESSWWYFESGKVYRFKDGRLEQVVPFDPVHGL